MLRDVIHPEATLRFDTSKPDGMPRKLLDVSRLHALGWRHRISLRAGVAATYRWFVDECRPQVMVPRPQAPGYKADTALRPEA
jgi:nucleoside-diphosphate-sugar epimerase